MNTNDIYLSVTQSIIKLLETHLEIGQCPWIAFGQDNDFARNPFTQNYYRGINQLLLGMSLRDKGYLKNMWGTYIQIKKRRRSCLKE